MQSLWSGAAAAALAIHGCLLAAVLFIHVERSSEVPEPVMVVELAPPGPDAPAQLAAAQATQAQPELARLPDFVRPRIAAPEVSAPIPREAVAAPRLQPVPLANLPVLQNAPVLNPAPAPSPATAPANQGNRGADSPQAKKKAARYYSLLMAHLNRNKRYPAEAKKALQQGVVTVRFTVERSGAVSASSIKRSSGSDLLDRATLDLMQRVSPLPPIPLEMERERLTISLPIDYSLNSK